MKIKHLAPILFFISLQYKINSQEKKITVDLSKEKRSIVLQVIDLNKENWLFYTGKSAGMNKKNIDSKLSLYEMSDRLKWEVPVERKTNDQWGKIDLLATPDYIYHIEKIAKYPSLGDYKELFITIIPVIKGQPETADFENVQKVIQNEIGSFAADKQLCFINYNYESNEKAVYYLHQLDISSKQTKEVKLNLPIINEEDENKGWYDRWLFIGEKDKLLYFYSKELKQNETEQLLTYHLIKIKLDGSVSDKMDIAMHPDKNRFFSPCDQTHPGIDYIPDIFTFKNQNTSGKGGLVYAPRIGSFGDIYFDLVREEIFTYGLFNYGKPYKYSVGRNFLSAGQKAEYAGFYVNKYDLSGKSLWQVNYDFPDELKLTDKRLTENVASDNQSLLKPFNNNQFILFKLLTFDGVGKNIDPNLFSFYIEDKINEPLQVVGQRYVYGKQTIFFSKKYSVQEIPLNEEAILTQLSANNKNKSISYSLIKGKTGYLIEEYNEKENKYVYTVVDP